jgi:hypothetical protein
LRALDLTLFIEAIEAATSQYLILISSNDQEDSNVCFLDSQLVIFFLGVITFSKVAVSGNEEEHDVKIEIE